MLFRLSLLCLVLLALLALVHSAPTPPAKETQETQETQETNADGDWEKVKAKIRFDKSGRRGDSKTKYFHESIFHPHYDGRFTDHVLHYDDRLSNLTALVQTYLSTMHDIGAETWIMHGSLLGWWWNRKIMPWDTDIDVQMSEQSMHHLASSYNMTIHTIQLPGTDINRDYIIEVNPHYSNGSIKDKENVIDARWIDSETGLFIDITAVRYDQEREDDGRPGWMYCKDKHHFLFDDIFPLRESTFEDMPVKIPFAYAKLLGEEYGSKSMTNTKYENHRFDQTNMVWVPQRSYCNSHKDECVDGKLREDSEAAEKADS